MIPAHFKSNPPPEDQCGPQVTVTIKQPNPKPIQLQFPETPKTIGVFTETLTKSTLSEMAVSRVTKNLVPEVTPSTEVRVLLPKLSQLYLSLS